MLKEQVISKMMLVLSGDDLQRIEITVDDNLVMIINLDLHGLGRFQASRLVKNIIAITKGEFVINVIHGFNHGTVLKEMIMEEQLSPRVINRSCPAWNPGQTYLTIAA